MSVLLINGSPNKKGNTARLASELLDGRAYETLDLVDYKLYSYGQKFDDDQFDEIVSRMKAADIIVVGSPVYWHNMCGSGALDVGKGRVYHEPFCPDVWNGVRRHGQQFRRGQSYCPKAWVMSLGNVLQDD